MALSLLAALLPHCLQAQNLFDEMVYSVKETIFHLNAPTDDGPDAVTGATQQASARPGVRVRLYDSGLGGKPVKAVWMKPDGKNRWKATLKGDWGGKFYTFDTGHGETPGTAARAVGVNGRRGAIIDLATTNPAGWENDRRVGQQAPGGTPFSPSDLVIYELHHRDFSIDASSGLTHKGKFLALAEPKAIAYLKELGINAVHILPSFDFASIDETQPDKPQYNWGYDPLNYNVPEGSYATDATNPATRIREFKQMVMALHQAGIRVILDVVYNHTFNIEGSNFQLTWPDRYYRKTADGAYSNGSGCGNETASEQPLMRQYMLESVRWWMDEYHIDGFRFDLMGVHDIATMNAIRAMVNGIDPNVYIYGEGWSAGTCALPTDSLAMKANTSQLHGIGAFSDELRDALRGPFSDDTKGAFLIGLPGEEESLKFGIVGAVAHPQVDMAQVNYSKQPWADEPTQMVAYVSCHDDMCLADRLRAEQPGIGEDELIRLDLLAQTAVFTSQGVPFMLAGEEMLRTKKGVHNSFESPDSINHLDWTNLQRYPQVFAYYKNLIALRRHHPAFRLGKADKVRAALEFLPVQPCLVGFRLKDHAGGDAWGNIIVILNANREEKEVSVPKGTYTVVCENGVIDESGLRTVNLEGDALTVPAQSALILHD